MAPAMQEGRGTGADPGDVWGRNCSGVEVTFLTENGGGKTEDELKS